MPEYFLHHVGATLPNVGAEYDADATAQLVVLRSAARLVYGDSVAGLESMGAGELKLKVANAVHQVCPTFLGQQEQSDA